MEIKINREIRAYSESVVMGLSLRQSFFAALGVGAAVGVYYLCSEQLGAEMVSWACVAAAAPFAFLAFFKYNGMTAEQFVRAWIVSCILTPRRLFFKPQNTYYELLQQQAAQDKKKKKHPKKEVIT